MLQAEAACAGVLDVHEEEVANCGQHVFHRNQKTVRKENFGGARRNRTADNGFADHCLTTWRPRHRAKSVQLSVISSPLKKERFKSHRVNGDLRAKTGEESSPLAPTLYFTCKLFRFTGKFS